MIVSMDWIKDILLACQQDKLADFIRDLGFNEDWKNNKTADQIADLTEQRQRLILRHIQLLEQAGMIDGVTVRHTTDNQYAYGLNDPCLTIKGMNLLGTLKNNKLMGFLRGLAKEMGTDLTVQFIEEYTRKGLEHLMR